MKFFDNLFGNIGNDSSTWRGILKIVLSASGFALTGGQSEAVICTIISILGAVDVFRKDSAKK